MMFNALFIFFIISNVLAILMLVSSYVLTVIAKKKKSIEPGVDTVLPIFAEQHTLISRCFWCGTLFIFLGWLLCSSTVLTVDFSPSAFLSFWLFVFAIAWGSLIFVGIIFEIILRSIKLKSDIPFSIMSGIKSTLLYTVLYIVFSFLIA